jgi:AcrR family transcriptional regulator
MRDDPFPEHEVKRKLLEAAEELFAAKGFEAVSVRDVTQAAGMNVSAVNYHFGGRDAFVELVMTRCLGQVMEERLMQLDAVERRWPGRGAPLEEILEAFVRPLLSRVGQSALSEELFYRLMGRVFATHGDGMPVSLDRQMHAVIDRFNEAFAKALPSISRDDLWWRLHTLSGGLIHLLIHRGAIQKWSGPSTEIPTMGVLMDRFIRFAVAGLRDGEDVTMSEEVVREKGEEEGPQAMFNF